MLNHLCPVPWLIPFRSISRSNPYIPIKQIHQSPFQSKTDNLNKFSSQFHLPWLHNLLGLILLNQTQAPCSSSEWSSHTLVQNHTIIIPSRHWCHGTNTTNDNQNCRHEGTKFTELARSKMMENTSVGRGSIFRSRHTPGGAFLYGGIFAMVTHDDQVHICETRRRPNNISLCMEKNRPGRGYMFTWDIFLHLNPGVGQSS